MNNYLETDVLIIGGGISGSTAAVRLADAGIKTIMISRDPGITESNTSQAQGGIAILSENEDPEKFIKDIIKAGDKINYRPAVEQVVNNSKNLVKEILIDKIKVPFTKKGDSYDMAQEGGHSARRILNVRDMTGKVIQEHFFEYLNKKKNNLKILFRHTAIDLLTTSHHSVNPMRIYEPPTVIGAYVLNRETGKVIRIFAKKLILSTGGLSSIFLNSTNPSGAIGSGIAMAYRAGARLANLEYVQFHPTSLYHKEADSFLISEAVRGEGAKLLNTKGEYFMEKYSSLNELAPRDEVSRAIYEEMLKCGSDYVYLDLRSISNINIKERFPTIYNKCFEFGIDIEKKPIPVVPAAHYGCGGVLSDLKGKTSIRNLYAVGEVSSTGVHGANRLASVSLLEGLVWGNNAALDIIENIKTNGIPYTISEIPEWQYPYPQEKLDPALILQDHTTIKYIMWNYAGIIRTEKRLERAKADLEYLQHRIIKFYQKTEISDSIINLRDSVLAAQLVVKASLKNKLSKGAHFIKSK